MPALVLQGHLDVVPPGDPDDLAGRDPFSAEIRDGRAVRPRRLRHEGRRRRQPRAVAALRAAGVRLERPLAVHCVVGEEDGGLGAFATLRRGHSGEAAVITEPTSAQIVTATAGALTFRHRGGRAGPRTAACAHEGVSAFEAFLPIHAGAARVRGRAQPRPRPAVRRREPALRAVRRHGARRRVVEQRARTGWSPRAGFGVQLDEDPRLARAALRGRGHRGRASRTRGCASTGRW